jgi:hypothetical protein
MHLTFQWFLYVRQPTFAVIDCHLSGSGLPLRLLPVLCWQTTAAVFGALQSKDTQDSFIQTDLERCTEAIFCFSST